MGPTGESSPHLNNDWHRHHVRRSSKRSLVHVIHVGVHVVTLIALAPALVLSLAVVHSLVLAVAALQVLRALAVGSIRLDRLAGHVAAVEHAHVVDDDRQSDTVEQALACSCKWGGGWALGAPRQVDVERAVGPRRAVDSRVEEPGADDLETVHA